MCQQHWDHTYVYYIHIYSHIFVQAVFSARMDSVRMFWPNGIMATVEFFFARSCFVQCLGNGEKKQLKMTKLFGLFCPISGVFRPISGVFRPILFPHTDVGPKEPSKAQKIKFRPQAEYLDRKPKRHIIWISQKNVAEWRSRYIYIYYTCAISGRLGKDLPLYERSGRKRGSVRVLQS